MTQRGAPTIAELAWSAHEAEDQEDDLAFIAIMNEIERRGAWRAFTDEYRRLWPEHARLRGYANQ